MSTNKPQTSPKNPDVGKPAVAVPPVRASGAKTKIDGSQLVPDLNKASRNAGGVLQSYRY